MRVFHIQGDQYQEWESLPETLPDSGYLWMGIERQEFEMRLGELQPALQRWTGSGLLELHVSDLLNAQLPSNFDYTSLYDLLVFRRLAASNDAGRPSSARESAPSSSPMDTSPVGFAVFDRVLLTVHPADCMVREYFVHRLEQQAPVGDGRTSTRMPPNPADLALRMVNFMVDSYLELRRLLTRQLDELQRELFNPNADYGDWQRLLDSRNNLHLLEDTCEDQRAAITEWIDAYDELPAQGDIDVLKERELLRVRARDLLEHIERVLSHVRRLEASIDSAVQMHFSAQNNRTNEIMRMLTVVTAIFLPLNFVTGFFGMNFEALPFIHSPRGFLTVLILMFALAGGLGWLFWRRRYLDRAPE